MTTKKSSLIIISNTNYVRFPTTTSIAPETYLYSINGIMSAFPNIGFVESYFNLKSLSKQFKYYL